MMSLRKVFLIFAASTVVVWLSLTLLLHGALRSYSACRRAGGTVERCLLDGSP